MGGLDEVDGRRKRINAYGVYGIDDWPGWDCRLALFAGFARDDDCTLSYISISSCHSYGNRLFMILPVNMGRCDAAGARTPRYGADY